MIRIYTYVAAAMLTAVGVGGVLAIGEPSNCEPLTPRGYLKVMGLLLALGWACYLAGQESKSEP